MSIRTEDVDVLAAAVDLGVDPGAASLPLIRWLRRHPIAFTMMVAFMLALTAAGIAYLPSPLVAAISTIVAVAWCVALPPEPGSRQPRS